MNEFTKRQSLVNIDIQMKLKLNQMSKQTERYSKGVYRYFQKNYVTIITINL